MCLPEDLNFNRHDLQTFPCSCIFHTLWCEVLVDSIFQFHPHSFITHSIWRQNTYCQKDWLSPSFFPHHIPQELQFPPLKISYFPPPLCMHCNKCSNPQVRLPVSENHQPGSKWNLLISHFTKLQGYLHERLIKIK